MTAREIKMDITDEVRRQRDRILAHIRADVEEIRERQKLRAEVDEVRAAALTRDGKLDDIEAIWRLVHHRGDEIWHLRRRIAELEEQRQRVIELHTDSPAGVCPACGRIGEQSIHDDGLVPWPCPTILALNPQAGTR